jgi:excinuclease ABC subunit C
MIVSAIDDIPGLGPTRKKRLLKEFGSVKKMREIEEQDFVELPWLPEAVGRAVYAKLHGVERATIGKA